MAFEKGMHPGATWRKSDFEIHSPRDRGWIGEPYLPGGDLQAEDARAQWADQFVSACVEKGLLAIAITDHHDYTFVEYVQDAINRLDDEKIRPWLFPAIEVTCDDSSQCLVIFDVGIDAEILSRLYGGLLNDQKKPNPKEPTVLQTNSCGHDLLRFMNLLSADILLGRHSIILPHAGDQNSHKSVIRNEFHARFRKMPCDGVFASRSINDLKPSTRDKIWGKVPEWGQRRRGILVTGDNRNASFQQLGSHDCWIRLGEPTIESIRHALLADEARIVYLPPRSPSQRIVAVTISSTLTGDGFSLTFNDGFTALIGGRGSGKSAILEYVRFGLGRSAIDLTKIDDQTYDRERKLIQETLAGGEVKVKLERDGVVETWTRRFDDAETILVSYDRGDSEVIRTEEAQRRFRARAYYQKQLSTLVTDKQTAAEQITGIAAAESVDDRREADVEIRAARRAIESALQQLQEHWVVQAGVEQAQTASADIQRRISALQKNLETSGLSPEDQTIINQAPTYDRARSYLNRAESVCANSTAAVAKMRHDILQVLIDEFRGVSVFEELSGFADFMGKTRKRVQILFDQALSEIEDVKLMLGSADKVFSERAIAFETEHARAREQQSAVQSFVDDLARLNSELPTVEERQRAAEGQLKDLQEAPALLAQARSRLQAALDRRRSVLEMAAQQIQLMSGAT